MKIEMHEIPVRAVVEDYKDDGEEGVTGFGGRLNIRPKYQREFVYDDKKRAAVIDTVRKGYPLNVMYWMVNDEGAYEVLDGQQRTVSLCQYLDGAFSVVVNNKPMAFHNLTQTLQDEILDYKLTIYWCEGTDQERLDWFQIINIAGERLTDQEIRNAVYTGRWLTDAKAKFSKSNCAAYLLGSKYLDGKPLRQEYLETAISWASGRQVNQYMSDHQDDPNANALWRHFQAVIAWVEATFTTYRPKQMKHIDWGPLYEKYHKGVYDTAQLEAEIKRLMIDDDVTEKRGIYDYVFSHDETKLAIRAFSENQRVQTYEKQNGICPKCGNSFPIEEMHADHITPWSKGGRTDVSNCQMLCAKDNRLKGAI